MNLIQLLHLHRRTRQHLVAHAHEGRAAVHKHAVGESVGDDRGKRRVDDAVVGAGEDGHEDVVALESLRRTSVTCHTSHCMRHTPFGTNQHRVTCHAHEYE